MTTFDRILPVTTEVLRANSAAVERLDWLLINRDLNAKVRLIAPESSETDSSLRDFLDRLSGEVSGQLGPHAYPSGAAILYEVAHGWGATSGAECRTRGP